MLGNLIRLTKKNLATDWAFPVALFICVSLLAALRISGSSVGTYDLLLHGPHYKSPQVVFGEPIPIRSDEWLVNTALTVAQSKTGYRPMNPNLGNGEDMTVVTDVPYAEWSTLFKPQNWSFFLLPLEHAFAFKWWIMAFGLIGGCYWFLMTLWPKERGFAILTSLGVFFSPFLQWWYSNGALAPISYSLIILVLLLHLERTHRTGLRWLFVGLLAYFMAAFALILYPPFQIACALAIIFFYAGHLVKRHGYRWKDILLTCRWPALAAIVAVVVVIAYIVTRIETIQAITNTVYPGKRTASSGGFIPFHFLGGFLNYQLQSRTIGLNYWSNQSESATFIFLWPYLLIPSAAILYRQIKQKLPLGWELLSVNLLLVLFCIRLFIPMPEIYAKLLLINSIPHNRLLVGFGILGLLQLVLLAKQIKKQTIPATIIASTAVATFFIHLLIIQYTKYAYPNYIKDTTLPILIAAGISLIVYLVMKGRHILAAALILIISAGSVFRIHPLYVGLGPLTKSALVEAIRAEDAPGAGWAMIESVGFINMPVAAGAKSYSGTYPYPQLDTWRAIEGDTENESAYNRYAFAVFVNKSLEKPIVLQQPDVFFVSYQPCEPIFSSKITRVISQWPLDDSCLRLQQTVPYPEKTFYIYSVKPKRSFIR
jgi:hypothetical protein